jgi:2-oxoglutarate ferredoxin oxidoreductase subunit beta
MSRSEFLSQRDVRWCPGCGDYAVLKYLADVLSERGWRPDQVIVVSGIGCSSRMPYYLSSYGFHTIHGRAPCIATGIALANPDLPLIVITGDGDGCSIGLHHLLHTVRRNHNMTILLLNNQVYGLTKGQSSPTSQIGQKTKTDLQGVDNIPLCPLTMVLSAGGTWAGRALDIDQILLKKLLHSALDHKGTSLLEIYQDCPVFNPKAFASHKAVDEDGASYYVSVWPNEPVIWNQKTLNFSEQSWEYITEPISLYQGQKLQALSLLFQKDVVAVGLLYQENRPAYPIRRDRENMQWDMLYEKAWSKLTTWES